MRTVSILMYHALENSEYPTVSKEAGELCYVLKEEKFREQMEYLHKEGFRAFLFNELLNIGEWPDKAVVITFDDGNESNFTLALPIIQKYGFKAEFFITTDWIGNPHYMNVQQLKVLHESGMGLGSHGLTHKFLDDMNSSEIEKELHDSMNVLTGITEAKVVSFSAPGGRIRRKVTDIAKNIGYQVVCTSHPGVLKQNSSFFSIPRLAVKADTELEKFKSMIFADNIYIAKLVRRNGLLFYTKRVLGNNVYEKIRKIILRIMS